MHSASSLTKIQPFNLREGRDTRPFVPKPRRQALPGSFWTRPSPDNAESRAGKLRAVPRNGPPDDFFAAVRRRAAGQTWGHRTGSIAGIGINPPRPGVRRNSSRLAPRRRATLSPARLASEPKRQRPAPTGLAADGRRFHPRNAQRILPRTLFKIELQDRECGSPESRGSATPGLIDARRNRHLLSGPTRSGARTARKHGRAALGG